MGRAIGFAVVVLTIGVLMPQVLNALEHLLLIGLQSAALLIETIPSVSQLAD